METSSLDTRCLRQAVVIWTAPPDRYCIHLSGEDVFQAVAYAYVAASQAQAGAKYVAPVLACVQVR